MVEGYWESASLKEIQRKLQNLELEEDKNDQKHAGKFYSFAQSNFIEDAEFALKRRNKKQRLSLDEKILIYKSVKFQKQRTIDVAKKNWSFNWNSIQYSQKVESMSTKFVFWSR